MSNRKFANNNQFDVLQDQGGEQKEVNKGEELVQSEGSHLSEKEGQNTPMVDKGKSSKLDTDSQGSVTARQSTKAKDKINTTTIVIWQPEGNNDKGSESDGGIVKEDGIGAVNRE
ncbi:hypothetical protein HAX54_010242 [Datura stramonium]|uniref:Uncharacterized protein n=1 Tax=Datura stramonium TaxID=4076 RepID=A0ABS8RYI3_DATST|nr:hypothetical protein [Datura stramonium]